MQKMQVEGSEKEKFMQSKKDQIKLLFLFFIDLTKFPLKNNKVKRIIYG